MDTQSLRISAQRALLGNITSHVRMVKVGRDGNVITFTAIISEVSDERTAELLSVAATEIVADFPQLDLRENVSRDDSPLLQEDVVAEGWVFARAD